MDKDPLVSNLPFSNEDDLAIKEISQILGYEQGMFNKILRSLLIEELLDRLTPKPLEIDELKMRADHIRLLKDSIEGATQRKWNLELILEFWTRIRNLDSTYKRINVSFERKLQVLASLPLECVVCKRRPPEVVLHVDHIYAASKGGPNEVWNLQLLCTEHNLRKSNHLSWILKM